MKFSCLMILASIFLGSYSSANDEPRSPLQSWYVQYFYPASPGCYGKWTYKSGSIDGDMIFSTRMSCSHRILDNDVHVRIKNDVVTASGELKGFFRGISGFCEFSGDLFGNVIRNGHYFCSGRTNELQGWQADNVSFPTETSPMMSILEANDMDFSDSYR